MDEGMTMEVELLPAKEILPVNTYVPSLVMNSAVAKEHAQTLRDMVKAVLIPEVDYGVIPGTNKPSLLKPGAESLLKWFGFGHEFETPDVEWRPATEGDLPQKWGVTYRCVVTKILNGQPIRIATCDGYASRDESKWKKSPWNTIIKMAQKRALVGAALQSTGMSGLFTQDIEDYGSPDGKYLDVTALLELLNDEQKERMRSVWRRSKWPSPTSLIGMQALEVAFQIGVEYATSAPADMNEDRLLDLLTGGDGDGGKSL